MASLGHIAVGMAAARAFRGAKRPRFALFTAMVLWSALSLLPDADVLGFRFGIAYEGAFGHRGATHSLLFPCLLALIAWVCAPAFGTSRTRTALCALLVVLSHPLLDTLTDGGLGCALFWPFDDTRYFAPITPIPVAPIGRALFSRAGLHVGLVELVMFSPVWLYALWPRRASTFTS